MIMHFAYGYAFLLVDVNKSSTYSRMKKKLLVGVDEMHFLFETSISLVIRHIFRHFEANRAC